MFQRSGEEMFRMSQTTVDTARSPFKNDGALKRSHGAAPASAVSTLASACSRGEINTTPKTGVY